MARFSEITLDHFQNPRNRRRLDNPDLVGVAGVPGRGRYVVLYLKLDGGRIAETAFQTHGCGATIASASILTELIAGRPAAACLTLLVEDVIEALGGMPPDKRYCPAMALQALHDALADFRCEGASRRAEV